MEPYTYNAPLSVSSIRLARILPESSSKQIHISLQVTDLSTDPVYDALSYTWGRPCTIFPSAEARDAPPEPPLPVICDGKELLVGKNLHDYLQIWLRMAQLTWAGTDERVQRAREKGLNPPDALWIDAICINQRDVIEKNHQVSMMGRIYSQSQRVVIWLGPEDKFVRPALKLLFELSSVTPSEAATLRRLPDDDKCRALGVPSIASSEWWAVFGFLNRSWFTRAWIVQELALAHRLHVQCGMLTFDWPALSQACRVLREARLDEGLDGMALMEMEGPRFLEPLFYEDLMPILRTEERPDSDRHLFGSRKGHANNSISFVVSLETIRLSCAIHLRADFSVVLKDPRYLTRGNGVPMFELLDEARQTDCFDPRDKIYAFLEVGKQPYYQAESPSDARRELIPDYRLQVAEVYLQAAWYLLLSARGLNLLSIAYSPREEGEKTVGLSSWVPDWSSRRAHMPMTGLHAFMSDKWYAAGKSTWSPPAVDKLYKPYLAVQGSLVDIISAVAEDSEDFTVSKAGVVAAKLPEQYPWASPPQRSSEAFWRTLIADSSENQHPSPDFNVLFYNDIWLHEMTRAAREQFESLEKEKEWYRFVESHSPLFESVAGSLKRTKTTKTAGQEDLPTPEPVELPGKGSERVRDPTTQSAIDHLIGSMAPDTSAHMSQLDVALSLMVRGAGFALSQDGQLNSRETEEKDDVDKVENEVHEDTRDNTNGDVANDTQSSADSDEESAATSQTPKADVLEPEFRRLMTRFTRKRRVFITEKHYLGNGLETLDVGDQVWLLAGAKVPMVLRPSESGKFRLVGDAYVHGLMHGEAWLGGDSGLRDIELE